MDNLISWAIIIFIVLAVIGVIGNISAWFYKQAIKDLKEIKKAFTKDKK